MNFTLFDDFPLREQLMPFTAIRTIAHIRVGIFCIYEKWEKILQGNAFFRTASQLQAFFSKQEQELNINATLLPDDHVLSQILALQMNESLIDSKGTLLAYRGKQNGAEVLLQGEARMLKYVWDIFAYNGEELRNDFE